MCVFYGVVQTTCTPNTTLLLHGMAMWLPQGRLLLLPTGFSFHALTHSSPSFPTHTSSQNLSHSVGRSPGTGLQEEEGQSAAPARRGPTTKQQANTHATVKHEEALHPHAASGHRRGEQWARDQQQQQ
jgi:hypothetical protein